MRGDYALPRNGAAVPVDTVLDACGDAKNGAHLYVQNGLNGNYFIVERLFIDSEGDVVLCLT